MLSVVTGVTIYQEVFIMLTSYDALIVGGGIFGLTTALELRQRGYKTAVFDPGPIPHPLAASTDISKVIRMEYGADELYMEMAEKALEGWQRWNEEFPEKLYHQSGVTMITRQPMQPGGYEYESYALLLRRGHAPLRLDSATIAERFPAWKAGAYVDGYFHSKGGYAESGRVVEQLAQQAQAVGVTLYAGQTITEILSANGRVGGVRTSEGQLFQGGIVLVAAGAWTQLLVPELEKALTPTGHPVFHLKTADTALFKPPSFTVFTADIANSGWYGFPVHPRQGVIKVANHGVGQIIHPVRDQRQVTGADIRQLRNFLESSLPTLKDATITYTRRCLYSDTPDGHFWIDHHPEITGLVVAAGGSGHAFKFAPILGGLIADAIERRANPYLTRFRWREFTPETRSEEAARYQPARSSS